MKKKKKKILSIAYLFHNAKLLWICVVDVQINKRMLYKRNDAENKEELEYNYKEKSELNV